MKKEMYSKGGASGSKGAKALMAALKKKGYEQGGQTAAKARMTSYADGGGLMGFRSGGCVLKGLKKK